MTLREFFSNSYVKLIFKLLLMVFVVWVLYLYRGKIIALLSPFIISLIIAYLLNPVVVLLQKQKVPRGISVMIIYLAFFSLIFVSVAKLIPIIENEITRLESLLPEYTTIVNDYILNINDQIDRLELPEGIQTTIQDNTKALEQALLNFIKSLPQIGFNLAATAFQIFLVLVLTFYSLRDFYLIRDTFLKFISPKRQQKVIKVMGEIDYSLGSYIRGQLIVCTFIGILTYLWLRIIGVEFALLLGVVAGITNIIPYFGPWIGAVPSVLVALFTSPMLAVKVIIGITVIQQIESSVVAPQVIGKKMGMHPLMVLFSLLAGGRFFGVIGMIIGVPTVAVIRILIKNFLIHYFPNGVFKS